MSFTVRSLIDLPAATTRSLTPGIGEDRRISWAHVCELAEPWRWLGEGALVMTTGLPVPEAAEDQCAYFEGMHRAGIAAVTIGENMSAPPLAESALEFAAELGFPVLETAYETPFIVLATAVVEAAQEERARRIRSTELMYAALRSHAAEDRIGSLLDELGEVLGCRLSLHAPDRERTGAHGSVERISQQSFAAPLLALGKPELRFVFAQDARVDYSLLQHAAGIVSSALSIGDASRRSDWMHGSILLGNLADGTVPTGLAERLVAAHHVAPPYLLSSCRSEEPRSALDAAQAAFASARVPALATIKDGHLLLLTGDDERMDDILTRLAHGIAGAEGAGRIGSSGAFTDLDGFTAAARQSQIALARTGRGGGVARFDAEGSPSLFLPSEPDQLRAIARQVLGPLQAYDRQRGTPLVHTLRVFLEENRSWVRAAERLFVHRQTLVARIARIETVTGRDLTSMEDAAECWFAIRAAVASGELEPASGPEHTNV